MRASGDDDDILFIMRELRGSSAHGKKRAMFTKKKSSVEIKSEKRCHVCRVLVNVFVSGN